MPWRTRNRPGAAEQPRPFRFSGRAAGHLVALATTSAKGFGNNSSLCHGDLGNLELLLAAQARPEYRTWAREVERDSARVIDGVESGAWKSGLPEGVWTPGLMVGLAVVGYGMLRIAAPDRVPSLLSLAPPVGAWPGRGDTGASREP